MCEPGLVDRWPWHPTLNAHVDHWELLGSLALCLPSRDIVSLRLLLVTPSISQWLRASLAQVYKRNWPGSSSGLWTNKHKQCAIMSWKWKWEEYLQVAVMRREKPWVSKESWPVRGWLVLKTDAEKGRDSRRRWMYEAQAPATTFSFFSQAGHTAFPQRNPILLILGQNYIRLLGTFHSKNRSQKLTQ